MHIDKKQKFSFSLGLSDNSFNVQSINNTLYNAATKYLAPLSPYAFSVPESKDKCQLFVNIKQSFDNALAAMIKSEKLDGAIALIQDARNVFKLESSDVDERASVVIAVCLKSFKFQEASKCLESVHNPELKAILSDQLPSDQNASKIKAVEIQENIVTSTEFDCKLAISKLIDIVSLDIVSSDSDTDVLKKDFVNPLELNPTLENAKDVFSLLVKEFISKEEWEALAQLIKSKDLFKFNDKEVDSYIESILEGIFTIPSYRSSIDFIPCLSSYDLRKKWVRELIKEHESSSNFPKVLFLHTPELLKSAWNRIEEFMYEFYPSDSDEELERYEVHEERRKIPKQPDLFIEISSKGIFTEMFESDKDVCPFEAPSKSLSLEICILEDNYKELYNLISKMDPDSKLLARAVLIESWNGKYPYEKAQAIFAISQIDQRVEMFKELFESLFFVDQTDDILTWIPKLGKSKEAVKEHVISLAFLLEDEKSQMFAALLLSL